jgi:hypothetical protein
MKYLILLALVGCSGVQVGDCFKQNITVGPYNKDFFYTVTKVTESEVYLEDSEWVGKQPYTFSIDTRLLEFYDKVEKNFCDKDVED